MSQTTALREAATGNAVAKKEAPKDFPAMLDQWKGEIALALPRHLNADRMARIALTCFRNVPKLGDCDPKSVFAAVIQAAQLGIEPGLMGEAHLIPYGNTCQLIPGYQGLIKLAKQTGQVTDIYAMAVRENDKFSCTFGLNRTIEHVPLAGKGGFPASTAARGEVLGFYAVAVFKDGSRTFVVMGKDEVDRIRDASQGYKMAMKYKKDSPWISNYEEMGNKTAIRRLCKTLPKSPELAQALALEDTHGKGQPQNIDLKDAIEGTYTATYEVDADAGESIDPESGEITATSAAPEPAAQQEPPAKPAASKRATAAAAAAQQHTQTAAAGPTIHDALSMVNNSLYEDAEDLVRGEPFTDTDRKEIEVAIRRHKNGERV